MDNQIYGAELDLKIDRFKAKANEARQTAQQLGKELGRGVTAYDLKNAGYYVKDFNNELKDTSNEMRQVNVTSATASVSIETGFSKGLKSLKRFALSLFGIRSIWSLISRGASAYIAQNEALNSQIQLTSYTLGAVLAPVIEKVINAAQYGVIIIAKLIQFFTGYNALAKLTEKNLTKTSKAAKTLNKNLAGFDEITNLNPDTGGGLAGGINNDLNALKEFQEKIKEVEEWINKFKQTGLGQFLSNVAGWISKIDGKTALLVGGSLKALWKLLGGGKAAAAGTSSILGTILMIGLAAGTTYAAFKKWSEVFPEIEKAQKDVADSQNSTLGTNKKIVKSEDDIRNKLKDKEKISDNILQHYKDNVGLSLAQVKNAKETNTVMNALLGTWMDTNAIAESEVKKRQEGLKTLYEIYKAGKLTKDQEEYVRGILNDQLNEYREILKNVNVMSPAYETVKEKIKETKNMLRDMGEDIPTTTQIMGTQFANLFTLILTRGRTTFTGLGNMIKTLSSGLGTLFSAITGKNIKDLGNALKNSVVSKLTSLFGKFNSFDVGTNYVPNDQMALVHKGEAIVPKKYNPAIGGGVNNNDDVVNAINVLNQTLINKNMNAYISRDDIGKASVDYINNKTRQLGESVIS